MKALEQCCALVLFNMLYKGPQERIDEDSVDFFVKAMPTLYWIALVPAPYQKGLSFTHKMTILDRFLRWGDAALL